jgi:hypothetical protein
MIALHVTLDKQDVASKYGTLNTHAICNNNEKSSSLQHIGICCTFVVLENTFDILDTQHKGPFRWCSIPHCYQFISFVLDVPPLTSRHTSATLFAFVECPSFCLDSHFG